MHAATRDLGCRQLRWGNPFPAQEHKIITAYKNKQVCTRNFHVTFMIQKKDTQLKKKYIHNVITKAVCYALMDGDSFLIPVMENKYLQ